MREIYLFLTKLLKKRKTDRTTQMVCSNLALKHHGSSSPRQQALLPYVKKLILKQLQMEVESRVKVFSKIFFRNIA